MKLDGKKKEEREKEKKKIGWVNLCLSRISSVDAIICGSICGSIGVYKRKPCVSSENTSSKNMPSLKGGRSNGVWRQGASWLTI